MRSEIILGEGIKELKTVGEKDINLFAEVSGDKNILHMSDDNAFGKRIAHGILMASYISKIIGMDFPGEGTIYLEQDCRFIKPIFIGDSLTIEITFNEIIKKEKGIIKLINVVTNQDEEVVLEGYSIVKIPSSTIIKEKE